MLTDVQGRDLTVTAELALSDQGDFLAMRAWNLSNLGAYAASFVPLTKGTELMTSLYRTPVAPARARAVFSNTVSTAPYRSAGRPEVMFVIALGAPDTAAARVKSVAVRTGIIFGERSAWLHRHASYPLHMGFEPHDMHGLSKSGLGRGTIADHGIDCDIRRIPQLLRIWRRSRHCRRHRRQRAVTDDDKLGGVLGGRKRLGNDQRDRLAHKSDPANGQRQLVRHRDRRAVGVCKRDVGRASRCRRMGHRAIAVGQILRHGQYRDNAGRSRGGSGRDRGEFGVGMR
jgi:Molybdopterin-binding domain of aldehyde dehydrogenase